MTKIYHHANSQYFGIGKSLLCISIIFTTLSACQPAQTQQKTTNTDDHQSMAYLSDTGIEMDSSQSAKISTAKRSRHAMKDSIGNLNGEPVVIPWQYMTGPIEYADSKERYKKNIRTPRTFASEIKSFGFDFNYEKNIVWTIDTDREYSKDIKKPKNAWISITIFSGASYPKEPDRIMEKYLERQLSYYPTQKYSFFYQKEAFPEWDLMGYKTIEYSSLPKNPHKYAEKYRNTEDIFYKVNENNEIINYILCSNSPVLDPPCEYRYLMKDKKLKIELRYGRHLLPNWKKIEEMATQHILSFYHNTNN